MTVDVRTRVDRIAGQQNLDVSSIFEDTLPRAFDECHDILDQAARWLDPPPLTIAVGSEQWTLEVAGASIVVHHGSTSTGAMTLSIEPEQLTGLIEDQMTPMSWFSNGSLRLEGHFSSLLDWWLLVRGALDGLTPTGPGSVTFNDQAGAPIDLHRTFSMDDGPEAWREYIEATGYLHLRNVFSGEEMAQISSDMDEATPRYHSGDSRSWWASTSAGEERLVRMQHFDDESATVAGLLTDDRIAAIAGMTGDGHQVGDSGSNRIEALFKPIGIVSGISDVPWHKDCSLGRHSYECCALTVGISVTGAGPDSGQLQMRAGSHRAHVWPALLQPRLDLPIIGLPTETGDVTVHLSCTLHMAQPPTARERRVLYAGLPLPAVDHAATAAARDRLRTIRERASVSVSQPPSAAVTATPLA